MWKKFLSKSTPAISSGVSVTLDELIALRSKAAHHPIAMKKNSQSLFAGQHLVKIRGRGIEFDTTREYQAGDDVRRMAWRVTARSLKPHIKVYHEERERPIWLGVDLSPSLYFGTRCMYKSVASIKAATDLGWSYLHKRERIGAFIATPNDTLVYTPQMREQNFLLILKSLAQFSSSSKAFTENNCLQALLLKMQQHVRPGHLLFIFSDFMQFDHHNQKHLLHLSERAQVKLFFVYDVFEAESPPAYQYIVTDGNEAALFNMESAKAREHYRQQFQAKLKELTTFSRQHNIALQVLCTDQTHKVNLK